MHTCVLIDVLCLQFTVFICVLFILPTAHPTTALNMNYAIVAIGAVVLIVAVCWTVWGRFHFVGPVKTVEEERRDALAEKYE